MYKKIATLLTALALVLGIGLTNAGPASAAWTITESRSCTTSGGKITVTVEASRWYDANANLRTRPIRTHFFSWDGRRMNFDIRFYSYSSYIWQNNGYESYTSSFYHYPPNNANSLVAGNPRIIIYVATKSHPNQVCGFTNIYI